MPTKPKSVNVDLWFPPKFAPFMEPHRWKIAYGGRGAGKTVSIASMLLLMACKQPLRIVCAREFQASIRDSVHQTLCDRITDMRLGAMFDIGIDTITGKNGSTFRFVGLRNNVSQIKSYAKPDIVWIEEADNVTHNSWEILIPTMRDGTVLARSEIWVSFNPKFETDATYKRLVLNKHKLNDAVVIKVNYYDNDLFPAVLREEMEACKANDHDEYLHVYEGEPKKYLEGAVYGTQLREADEAERITTVPYMPQYGVEAFFDIGWGDATAIWVAQRVNNQIHLIDYVQGKQRPLDSYLWELSQKKFPIDRYHLPHDAVKHDPGTGLSYQEILKAKGNRVVIVPRLSIDQGISAVRSIFPTMYFDARNCEDGIRALRNYRFELVKDKSGSGGFKSEPVHDVYSHAADSLRYLAVSFRPPKETERLNIFGPGRFTGGSTGWMGL